MSNHPNRGREAPAATAAEVRKAREGLGLTQEQAASLALVSVRAWIKWESDEHPISAPAWALFRLRTKLIKLRDLD
jgi:DNA-binding transcriptional regulator YiaG